MKTLLFCIRQWEWWAMIPFAIVCILLWLIEKQLRMIGAIGEYAFDVALFCQNALSRAALRYPPMVRMQEKIRKHRGIK